MLTFRHSLGVLSLALAACSIDASGRLVTPEPGSSDDNTDGTQSDDAEDDAGVMTGVDAARTDTKDSAKDDGNDGCDHGLNLVIRDFRDSHPDFEKVGGDDRGLVKDELGGDQKPVYASNGSTPTTSGPNTFKQWYNDVPGINQRFALTLELTEDTPGTFIYDNAAFFPIDNKGFGNGPKGIDIPLIGNTIPDHNYLFTTEAHLKFTYAGGETLKFTGGDDVWVFINGQLVIDLGGVHAAETAIVKLDDQAGHLDIETGKTYAMDIFHAERHTPDSTYRIETTIDLSCVHNVPLN